jgi:hypothetical protein
MARNPYLAITGAHARARTYIQIATGHKIVAPANPDHSAGGRSGSHPESERLEQVFSQPIRT